MSHKNDVNEKQNDSHKMFTDDMLSAMEEFIKMSDISDMRASDARAAAAPWCSKCLKAPPKSVNALVDDATWPPRHRRSSSF